MLSSPPLVAGVLPRGKSKASRFVKELFDERAGAAPARVAEEVRKIVEGDGGFAARRALVVRPVDEHRAPDDGLARDVAPEAAVLTVVAVVAHREVVAFGHVEDLAPGGAARGRVHVGVEINVVGAFAGGRRVVENR